VRIDTDADVTMTASTWFAHLCPFKDEVDHGRATITWRCNGATLELHALADYLRRFKDTQLSHEEVTDRIRHDLSATPGVELLTVETTWDTAGMEIRCATRSAAL
jgi:NADPH-dependent 7-cyano-7-deazaguanine reductase QueF